MTIAPLTVTHERLEQFRAALDGALANGAPLLEALQRAGDQSLSDLGDPGPLLHIAANLVRDFENEAFISCSADALVLTRMVEAVAKMSNELALVGQTNLNLPFLTSDDSGPKHLNRTLTRAQFAELAERPLPEIQSRPPPPEVLDDDQLEERKKMADRQRKKRWWPF